MAQQIANYGPGEAVGLRHATKCGFALLVVIILGTSGFMILEEDWTIWKSLFFTLITITTVGYGDEGVSERGQAFAAMLLLFGIATATYCLSNLVKFAVSCQFAWRRKMLKKISALKDHNLVCGYGKIGRSVCRQLAASGVPFVVIENDNDAYNAALADGHMAILGSAHNDGVLRDAGASSARAVVCATNSDAENVFITLSVKQMNPVAFIVSRAGDPDDVAKIQRAGASLVISPYAAAGESMATALLKPHLTHFLQNANGGNRQFELSEVKVEPKSRLDGMTVAEFGQTESSIVFVALSRQGHGDAVRPSGGDRFQARDVVIVAGPVESLSRMCAAASTRDAEFATCS